MTVSSELGVRNSVSASANFIEIKNIPFESKSGSIMYYKEVKNIA